MTRKLHPFTSLGLLLFVSALALFLMGGNVVAIMLCTLAYGLTLLEFQRFTSNFQFSMMLISGTTLGIAMDLGYGHWPLLTMAVLMAVSATILRQVFMQHFTYVNLLWVDSGLAVLALAVYGLAIWDTPFLWTLWLPPLLPLIVALGLTASYLQDAQHMRNRTRFGYQVQLGASAPDLALPDQDGRIVRLSDYRGKHPVLLIFVRGDWCPGCHMMLRTYERNRERFMSKGVHVLGIGPDDIKVNKDMVERIGVQYRMLSDEHQQVSAQYGVIYTNPVIELGVDYAEGIPLPASFLVDVDGIVRYVSRPDRVGEFLDPASIFGILDDLPSKGQVAWT